MNSSFPISFPPVLSEKHNILPSLALNLGGHQGSLLSYVIAQTRMEELNKGSGWEIRKGREKKYVNSKSGFQDMACFRDPFNTSSIPQEGRSLFVFCHQLSSSPSPRE